MITLPGRVHASFDILPGGRPTYDRGRSTSRFRGDEKGSPGRHPENGLEHNIDNLASRLGRLRVLSVRGVGPWVRVRRWSGAGGGRRGRQAARGAGSETPRFSTVSWPWRGV